MPRQNTTPQEQDTFKQFRIEVQDRRSGAWRLRTEISFEEPVTINRAIRKYVVSARRPQAVRKGQARSAKGKLFRAVPIA